MHSNVNVRPPSPSFPRRRETSAFALEGTSLDPRLRGDDGEESFTLTES